VLGDQVVCVASVVFGVAKVMFGVASIGSAPIVIALMVYGRVSGSS
jgi:hypothetical protein